MIRFARPNAGAGLAVRGLRRSDIAAADTAVGDGASAIADLSIRDERVIRPRPALQRLRKCRRVRNCAFWSFTFITHAHFQISMVRKVDLTWEGEPPAEPAFG